MHNIACTLLLFLPWFLAELNSLVAFNFIIFEGNIDSGVLFAPLLHQHTAARSYLRQRAAANLAVLCIALQLLQMHVNQTLRFTRLPLIADAELQSIS